MTSPGTLDAHQCPPESMRAFFKRFQKSTPDAIQASLDVLDCTALSEEQLEQVNESQVFDGSKKLSAFRDFLGPSLSPYPVGFQSRRVEIKALPGLFIFPSLLPPKVQVELLNRLLHRDLANPVHKTNLDLHYLIPREMSKSLDSGDRVDYETSLFTISHEHTYVAKDPAVHNPLSVQQMLQKKLRWMTLGGQYDWTAKQYPSEVPPAFPEDIGQLLKDLFPDVDAQAAIVNLYSPGDTLSVHRDVSEECERGLISLSIGCDAVFILGNEDGSQTESVRLRSGDAVLMTGKSRFAWHAVPKVISDTCPEWLRDWPWSPESPQKFGHWRGWMNGKRINVNARQMRDA